MTASLYEGGKCAWIFDGFLKHCIFIMTVLGASAYSDVVAHGRVRVSSSLMTRIAPNQHRITMYQYFIKWSCRILSCPSAFFFHVDSIWPFSF